MNKKRMLASSHSYRVSVGGDSADFPGFTSQALQNAISDAARHGGGTVELDAGTFEIIRPVRLFNGVALEGQGIETCLKKCAGVKTELQLDADYGELQVNVVQPERFMPGMGIQVYDEKLRYGWDECTAIISNIVGNTLYFEEYLPRDYRADRNGTVTNACSVIEAVDVRDVHISNLRVDGNKEHNAYIGGCRGGGVYLHKASHCTISGVHVTDFNGDGFSWQITEDIRVDNCEAKGCTGSGFHPGAGSFRTQLTECRSLKNGEDGIYICWRVQEGMFRGNRLEFNQGSGISIGHKDTDNIIRANVIRCNGHSGIMVRKENPDNGAHRNVISNNVIENNGGSEFGYGIVIHGHVHGGTISGNTIVNMEAGAQRIGIWQGEHVSDIAIVDNAMEGHADGNVVIGEENE